MTAIYTVSAEPSIVICQDCDAPSYLHQFDDGRCPNPACFPGLREYRPARIAWEQQRLEYKRAIAQRAGSGVYFNSNSLDETFAREHPAPKPADYRRS